MNRTFLRLLKPILSKYSETTLAARWREATSFGAGSDFLAFWVRDSGYVVNIVWLNSDGIRDITLLMYAEEAQTDNEGANGEVPEHAHYNESMFNFLPLSNIIAFEVREGPNVAHQFGLGVNGKKLGSCDCECSSWPIILGLQRLKKNLIT